MSDHLIIPKAGYMWTVDTKQKNWAFLPEFRMNWTKAIESKSDDFAKMLPVYWLSCC